MDEFIQLLTKQLGLSTTDGQSATGNILKLIQSHLDPALFAQISEKLPGVQGLISDAEGSAKEGGLVGILPNAEQGEKAIWRSNSPPSRTLAALLGPWI